MMVLGIYLLLAGLLPLLNISLGLGYVMPALAVIAGLLILAGK